MSLSAWVVGMGGRTPVAMTRSGLALLARFTISLVNLWVPSAVILGRKFQASAVFQ